jgi:hypothetical protein
MGSARPLHFLFIIIYCWALLLSVSLRCHTTLNGTYMELWRRVDSVVCCVLRVACCVLRVAYCVLRVACCVLRVACCVLRVACCVLRLRLRDACCVMRVA